jgi:hypothetical protein
MLQTLGSSNDLCLRLRIEGRADSLRLIRGRVVTEAVGLVEVSLGEAERLIMLGVLHVLLLAGLLLLLLSGGLLMITKEALLLNLLVSINACVSSLNLLVVARAEQDLLMGFASAIACRA